jgi:hypothetical protein
VVRVGHSRALRGIAICKRGGKSQAASRAGPGRVEAQGVASHPVTCPPALPLRPDGGDEVWVLGRGQRQGKGFYLSPIAFLARV